ncbi:hypothetical protein GY21_06795 [Cryobacterium roopkundense]|uniref:Peptidase S33 tripeptidyl aminopeptidase-like C-terminal domain-containing protein n=1 Tax=Cryobacterium roopkundense TaxID=1001240 RepID=A0A099JLQ6_9MICO|nr:hypothetical protein GY21_06795 [Cryobacterium roopkundense]
MLNKIQHPDAYREASSPVLVIAGRGDPLFPLSYTRDVYESIVAPHKELLILESQVHLLFNEDLDALLPPLLDRLSLLSHGYLTSAT